MRTNRRAGLQQRRILYHHALHAEVRAATHHAAQIMRVSDIFNASTQSLDPPPALPMLNGRTVIFNQENTRRRGASVPEALPVRLHPPWWGFYDSPPSKAQRLLKRGVTLWINYARTMAPYRLWNSVCRRFSP